MRRYGCLQAIVLSFYSRDLYRDVAKNWGAGVVLYLLLLLAICWAFLIIPIQKEINHGYGGFAEKFFYQVPEMTIADGKLKTPEDRPYLIMDQGNKVVAIIDTSGKYQTLTNSDAVFLVTEKSVSYKNDSKEEAHHFSSSLNMTVKPNAIKNVLETIISWSWVLLFPLMLLFSFIYRIVEAALYAIIGELFSVISKVSLTYGQIFRLTVFAMTPAIIIGSVLDWFKILFPNIWLCYFVLSMAYLVFAIQANKNV